MSWLRRKRRYRSTHQQLQFEKLETRQMLAADLLASLVTTEPVIPQVLQTDTVIAGELIASSSDQLPAELVIPLPTTSEVRSLDGTGNNLDDFELGSAGEQLLRVADTQYSDGISAPAGEDRPSAREISNVLVEQLEENSSDRQISAFIYAWGQFIDHDIDLTATQEDGETFYIEVPAGDPWFDPDNTGTQVITLTRSEYDEATGTSIDNPREQISEITAWIDGSVVYGSDQATADSLRAFEGGKLLTSVGDLLPTDAEGNFLAGDVRANENVELTSMQTLFVREHNWWAEEIARQDPTLSDEAIYQQARSIVIAEMQAITFNEFLPALLGADAIEPYQGYDSSVDPTIANEFSTAAYRMHTLINDDVEFFGSDGRAVGEEVELAEAFFNPDLLRETGIDSILKYLASSQSQEFDLEIVDSLRNFLFGQPGSGGFDLASLNIQRGRDHGLADYNSVREAYGLSRVESFAEISSDPVIQEKLEELYGSVDNIDLWVGTLAEDHLPGSSVGELTQTIVADQFQRLRDGDRLWYENIYSGASLEMIQSTSLADIIQRNTTVDNLQENVFFMQATVTGRVVADGASKGGKQRAEGVAGVTVELLDDEANVIDTTVTGAGGGYQFATFHETGDYQVRVVLSDRQAAATEATADVLISRGDEAVSHVDFVLEAKRRTERDRQHDRHDSPRKSGRHEAAFSDFDETDLWGLEEMEKSLRSGRNHRRR